MSRAQQQLLQLLLVVQGSLETSAASECRTTPQSYRTYHHWPPHQRPRSHGPATAVVSTKDNCCEVGASAMCTAMGGSLRCDRPATLSGEFNNSHHYTAATQACITLLGYISPFPANITIVLHFVLRFFALRNTMTYFDFILRKFRKCSFML